MWGGSAGFGVRGAGCVLLCLRAVLRVVLGVGCCVLFVVCCVRGVGWCVWGALCCVCGSFWVWVWIMLFSFL